MILKQYYLGCLAHASYLLGDEASATAIIVDPQRDIQQYLADAEKFGLQIRHVFLTHFHADFVAGHLELRDRCGATIHLGSRAKAEYAFVAMRDGDTLEFPGLRLEVLETPGHTIESISILVFDLQKDPGQFNNLAEDPRHLPLVLAYSQKLLSWRMEHNERGLTRSFLTENGVFERRRVRR